MVEIAAYRGRDMIGLSSVTHEESDELVALSHPSATNLFCRELAIIEHVESRTRRSANKFSYLCGSPDKLKRAVRHLVLCHFKASLVNTHWILHSQRI
ncbi:hypothetical protein [Rhizobium album]|uniref:hypothetical protein n=1 Tax=Metarhizobium album TaxID=2182425 RepID=UPI0014040E2D